MSFQFDISKFIDEKSSNSSWVCSEFFQKMFLSIFKSESFSKFNASVFSSFDLFLISNDDILNKSRGLRGKLSSASHLKTVGDSKIDLVGRVRQSNQSPNSIGSMRDPFD